MIYKVFTRDGAIINDECIGNIDIKETGKNFVELMRKIFKFKPFDKIRIETRIHADSLTETTSIYRKRLCFKEKQVGFLWRKLEVLTISEEEE